MQKDEWVDKKEGAFGNDNNQYGNEQSDEAKSLLCVGAFACGRDVIGGLLAKVVILTLPVLTAFK